MLYDLAARRDATGPYRRLLSVERCSALSELAQHEFAAGTLIDTA